MAHTFLLTCSIKNYDWGKLGTTSFVAQLAAHDPDFKVDKKTPYAELWMGTHPSGPSKIPSLKNITLSEYLVKNPDSLGSNITDNFKSMDIPFLFKVLSIKKALSIQAHPDKEAAQILFRKFPDIYVDNNHKPELAIALTEFKALCGFRPPMEIKTFIKEIPQFRLVVGDELADEFVRTEGDIECREKLKGLFTKFIKRPEMIFQPYLADLLTFLKKKSSVSQFSPTFYKSIKDLILALHTDFPGDIGCFCVFFLNIVTLKPGEAIYIAPSEPHAYISGDCIECMASSDNVVRGGLTPKFRDVNVLAEILSYKSKIMTETLFPPVKDSEDPYVMIYDPPVQDFAVNKIEINGQSSYIVKAVDSASILIVIEGEGKAMILDIKSTTVELKKGSVLFIASNSSFTVEIKSKHLLMYRAYCTSKITYVV